MMLQQLTKNYFLRIVLVAFSYYITGRLGLLLAVPPGYATAIWPPSGVALAALLSFGFRYWPGIFLGSFCLNSFISFDPTDQNSILLSGGIAAIIAGGATLQAIVGRWLVTRFIKIPNPLEHTKDIILLVLLGGAVSCLTNATISTLTLILTNSIFWQDFVFSWTTWWVGDSIGVMVFTPVLLLFLNQALSVSRQRKIVVTLALSAAFLLAVYIFFMSSKADVKNQRMVFEREAQDIHRNIVNNLESYKAVLRSLESFYAASEFVSRAEFRIFAGKLLEQYPSIHAISWIKNVTKEDRNFFEKSMHDEGIKNFGIKDLNKNGLLVVAPQRDRYFPLTYAEPSPENNTALGYDIYSETLRRAALDIAKNNHDMAATGRISLIRDSKNQYAFIIFDPIYTEKKPVYKSHDYPAGYIATGFLFPEMLEAITTRTNSINITFTLTDRSDKKNLVVLYDSSTADHKEEVSKITRNINKGEFERVLYIAGREWLLNVFPTSQYLALHHSWTVWWILTGGLVFTGMFGIFLLLVTGRAESIQNLVREKTAQLRDAEETFRSAMTYAPIGKALVAPDGKWLMVNAAICKLLGYSEAELLIIDFQKVTHPEDLEKDLDFVESMLKGEISNYQMEKRYFHKDGHTIWAQLSVSLVRNADGSPKYFISQIQDISDLKIAEKQRGELIKKLADSNTELERFAYVASHDLQEPLRMISNFSQLVEAEQGNNLDSAGREYIRLVTDSAKRMQDMVSDLLEYARVGNEGLRFSTLDMNDLVKRVFENLAVPILEREAIISQDQLPTINGNPVQIIRLLQNIISNALKYQTGEAKPLIHISAEDKGDQWQFSVQDNGIGIPEEFLIKIFEPFKKLHTWQQYRGTGLGLALCKKIVENHGGEIWAISNAGKGSVFYFTVPKSL